MDLNIPGDAGSATTINAGSATTINGGGNRADTFVNSEAPRFEPWTCANANLKAERTLEMIAIVKASDVDAMEMLHSLVEDAGAAFARAALSHRDELPF